MLACLPALLPCGDILSKNMNYARFIKFFLSTIFLILVLFVSWQSVLAQSGNCIDPNTNPCGKIDTDCLSTRKQTCEKEKKSLTNEIKLADYRIALTQAQIAETTNNIDRLEAEIASISGKIDNLESSLTTLSNVFIERIIASYKNSTHNNLGLLLFSSNKLYDLLVNLRYLQIVQRNDQKILIIVETTKINYTEQKKIREEKKEQLSQLKVQYENQKVQLSRQRRDKENFLATTENNEQRYQNLLAEAQREMDQIQRAAAFIFQQGTKKHVGKGDVIGVMGNTGYSFGAHLHFGAYSLNEDNRTNFNFCQNTENPFNYLSSQNLPFDGKSCDDVSQNQNKTVGSGGWNWPMSNPTVSQCYGHTPYYYLYPSCGYTHTGVDMYDNQNTIVRAVDEGDAYICRNCLGDGGNGVFIFHSNGKMSLYWHLQ